MKDVVVVRDGEFVGCAAPTSFAACRALEAISKTASWKTRDGQPSSKEIFAYLKENAEEGRRSRETSRDSIEKAFADSKNVAYNDQRTPKTIFLMDALDIVFREMAYTV